MSSFLKKIIYKKIYNLLKQKIYFILKEKSLGVLRYLLLMFIYLIFKQFKLICTH